MKEHWVSLISEVSLVYSLFQLERLWLALSPNSISELSSASDVISGVSMNIKINKNKTNNT